MIHHWKFSLAFISMLFLMPSQRNELYMAYFLIWRESNQKCFHKTHCSSYFEFRGRNDFSSSDWEGELRWSQVQKFFLALFEFVKTYQFIHWILLVYEKIFVWTIAFLKRLNYFKNYHKSFLLIFFFLLETSWYKSDIYHFSKHLKQK